MTKLHRFVNRCLRRILNIRWPDTISNNFLWEITKQEPNDIQIKNRNWRWIGHTLRKPASAIEKDALDWNPQGGRGRGRPRKAWRRTTEEEITEIGNIWSEVKALANQRRRWKSFTRSLCSIQN
jgi:hypothetical protein